MMAPGFVFCLRSTAAENSVLAASHAAHVREHAIRHSAGAAPVRGAYVANHGTSYRPPARTVRDSGGVKP
jgi:hypothetical protein